MNPFEASMSRTDGRACGFPCQTMGTFLPSTATEGRIEAKGHAGRVAATAVVATSVCQNCGSRRFRADRSMAGRLVCQSCGLAAGTRPSRSTARPSGRSRQQRWRWLVGLVIVVILIAVLMG